MKKDDGQKRVQVSFTKDQWELIKNLKGSIGKSDADTVRNIVISWLAEKSFITSMAKKKMVENDGG